MENAFDSVDSTACKLQQSFLISSSYLTPGIIKSRHSLVGSVLASKVRANGSTTKSDISNAMKTERIFLRRLSLNSFLAKKFSE